MAGAFGANQRDELLVGLLKRICVWQSIEGRRVFGDLSGCFEHS